MAEVKPDGTLKIQCRYSDLSIFNQIIFGILIFLGLLFIVSAIIVIFSQEKGNFFQKWMSHYFNLKLSS